MGKPLTLVRDSDRWLLDQWMGPHRAGLIHSWCGYLESTSFKGVSSALLPQPHTPALREGGGIEAAGSRRLVLLRLSEVTQNVPHPIK